MRFGKPATIYSDVPKGIAAEAPPTKFLRLGLLSWEWLQPRCLWFAQAPGPQSIQLGGGFGAMPSSLRSMRRAVRKPSSMTG